MRAEEKLISKMRHDYRMKRLNLFGRNFVHSNYFKIPKILTILTLAGLSAYGSQRHISGLEKVKDNFYDTLTYTPEVLNEYLGSLKESFGHRIQEYSEFPTINDLDGNISELSEAKRKGLEEFFNQIRP